jgi:site-specific DNA-methyltransferase (adenine-specific)
MSGEDEPRIEIIRGDCVDILRGIEAETYDAVVTDPPYSSGGTTTAARQASTRSKYVSTQTKNVPPDFAGDRRDQRSWITWCSIWLGMCLAAVKTGGVAMVFSDWRQVPSISDALQAAGWEWRRLVVWDKKNARPTVSGMFRQTCEFILIGVKEKLTARKSTDGGGIYPMGLFSHATANMHGRVHQTQKPVELMKYLLQIVPSGGRILDPFAGSGSTLVAAREMGMSATGIEIDEYYAKAAQERIDRAREPRERA